MNESCSFLPIKHHIILQLTVVKQLSKVKYGGYKIVKKLAYLFANKHAKLSFIDLNVALRHRKKPLIVRLNKVLLLLWI